MTWSPIHDTKLFTFSATLCRTPFIISPRPLITLFATHGMASDNSFTGEINSA